MKNINESIWEIYLRKTSIFLMGKIRASAKTTKSKWGTDYGRKHEWEVDIDTEWIYTELKKNFGKCAVTNIPFPLCLDYKKLENCPDRLWIPSADRINPNIGYVKGNVEFVCLGYNLMKSKYSDIDAKDFLYSIHHSLSGTDMERRNYISKEEENKILNKKNITLKSETMIEENVTNQWIKYCFDTLGPEQAKLAWLSEQKHIQATVQPVNKQKVKNNKNVKVHRDTIKKFFFDNETIIDESQITKDMQLVVDILKIPSKANNDLYSAKSARKFLTATNPKIYSTITNRPDGRKFYMNRDECLRIINS